MRMAKMAPNIAPGKNPATTAVVGNEGHAGGRAVVELCVNAEEEGEATGLKVAPVVSAVVDVDVDEEFDDVAVAEVVLSSAQMLFPWHVYPKGQQRLPHVGREAVSLVVLTEFFGCAVTFCSWTSQTIGEM